RRHLVQCVRRLTAAATGFSGGGEFAGVGEEFWFPVQSEGAGEPATEQSGMIQGSSEGESCANGLQQAPEGRAAAIKGECGRGDAVGSQSGEDLARADFDEQIPGVRGGCD